MKILYAAMIVAALGVSPAWAKGKAKSSGGGSKARAADARAVGELAGKFKWGMSPQDCIKLITEGVHAKYADMIKKEPDIYKQDQLRKDEGEEVQKVKDSYVKFDGITPGTKEWGTSIIQSEFAPRNDESMMTLWEKDQRRFLFFWHDKLYKQFIAFNAEHPVFAGKSFDDFAKLIQNRYGPAEMKFTQMKTKQDMKLDHLEWPASGDYQLYAIDQSEFYGNFCLVLFQPATARDVDKARTEHNTKPAHGNALIDAVTQQPKVGTDSNENIVDQITGKTPTKK
jgi:hypothetical protein